MAVPLNLVAAAAALLLVSCGHHHDGGGGGTPPPPGALEVTPAYFGGDGTLSLLDDGADLPLSLPPQGGHVLFVGAQMAGLATTTITLRGRLRDLDTDAIVAEEARTVVTRPVAGAPSLSETDPETYSQVANIAVCPDYATKAIDGQPYVLEVTVTELYVDTPRTASARRTITPRCPTGGADAALCVCECEAGYSLGKCPVSRGGGG